MILSHTHKFIYFKSRKTAGSSVQEALAIQCDLEKDIIAGHASSYAEVSTNVSFNIRNTKRFKAHILPLRFKKKLGRMYTENIWDRYYKIVNIRNPWDSVISVYFWHGRIHWPEFLTIDHKEDFPKYLKERLRLGKFPDSNILFCFQDKEPIMDCYLRFENLEEDYKKLCERLGLEYKELPRFKDKIRVKKYHYRDLHNDWTRKIIAERFAHYISYFGYTF